MSEDYSYLGEVIKKSKKYDELKQLVQWYFECSDCWGYIIERHGLDTGKLYEVEKQIDAARDELCKMLGIKINGN